LRKKQRKFVEYNGVKYPIRTFNVICEGQPCQYTIGVESLSDLILDKLDTTNGNDSEARDVDNQIYFYVEDEEIDLDPKVICAECLDIPMVFVSEEF